MKGRKENNMKKEQVLRIELTQESINKLIGEQIRSQISEFKREHSFYARDLHNTIALELKEIFINKYIGEIFGLIDKKKLAKIITERTTVEMAKRLSGVQDFR